MKILAAIALSISLATPAFAVTNSVWSEARFEYNRKQLQENPDFRNMLFADCQQHTARTENLRALSAEMHVPLSRVPATYCRRILRAYASNSVSYEDYLQYQTKHIESPRVRRLLQGK
ncbi:MAG: hypothetical protein KGI75_01095 [Rhizobiaceae bacterium]|nr:hypothetical protein [Rhizobiaceae bacterium]